MHAIMARNDNSRIADKLEASPEDLSQYPRATHALVNLLSMSSGVETSYLIVPAAMFFSSYAAFPLYYLGVLLTKRRSLSVTLGGIAAASYYPLAIAYHGFLPQAAFVPFVLTAALLEKKRIFPLAILLAGAVISYRFVSYLPLMIIVMIHFFENKYDVRKTALLILFAAGLATIDFWISIKQLLLVASGKSVILGAVQVFGNLSGFINPGIMTGVWFESDYRLVNPDRLLKYLPYVLAVPIFILALMGWKRLSKINSWKASQVSGLAASVIVIALLTQSPYSTGKMLSLLAPLVPVLFVGGVWQVFSNTKVRLSIIFTYFGLVLASNQFLLRGLSILPSSIFEEMKQVDTLIKSKPTIIHSDNDWLSYYVDSPSVDITGLHYLPDTYKEKEYRYGVFESKNSSVRADDCLPVLKTNNFLVCSYE